MTPARQFLVRYGRSGFVGSFAADVALTRGDRVVILGPRGVEFGEVLLGPDHRIPVADGTVSRRATAADEAAAERLEVRGRELLAAAVAGGPGLPLVFVDVELTLDETAILHALAWGACDATSFLDDLSAQFGLSVRLLDLSRTPAARDEAGCGKPGCGSQDGGCSSCGTGGGCSSGSCSRSAVRSAEELTAYFADLRQQMEQAGLVRTPLN